MKTIEKELKFQLTRSRGARRAACRRRGRRARNHFNSRAHVERDIAKKERCPSALISTHALTWSATFRAAECDTMLISFQLTRSRGARHYCYVDYPTAIKNFNSRAHVERDIMANLSWFYTGNFNSRAHVERDWQCISGQQRYIISTHALTWSATNARSISPNGEPFQLTRSRGARLVRGEEFSMYNFISTHALTWSATITGGDAIMHEKISTHALTWSATGGGKS